VAYRRRPRSTLLCVRWIARALPHELLPLLHNSPVMCVQTKSGREMSDTDDNEELLDDEFGEIGDEDIDAMEEVSSTAPQSQDCRYAFVFRRNCWHLEQSKAKDRAVPREVPARCRGR
jgi:hypothetical protein